MPGYLNRVESVLNTNSRRIGGQKLHVHAVKPHRDSLLESVANKLPRDSLPNLEAKCNRRPGYDPARTIGPRYFSLTSTESKKVTLANG